MTHPEPAAPLRLHDAPHDLSNLLLTTLLAHSHPLLPAHLAKHRNSRPETQSMIARRSEIAEPLRRRSKHPHGSPKHSLAVSTCASTTGVSARPPLRLISRSYQLFCALLLADLK
ncbi:unnamed protein product [Periconia digitata]|uniref:Uncharacterized protein n=1 Tax=Periconia digitata TaxID=1303443 RepID=A0A9W4UR83_9PLEO|nr:unnamed protein product [Periconia digitata]